MKSRTRFPSASETDKASFSHGPGGDPGDERFSTIRAIAEQLDVCDRTVGRWIDKKLLIAHRIAGVVRIAEGDFRAFLAAHRDN